MTYILILWMTYVGGSAAGVNVDGYMRHIEFHTQGACEYALKEVKREARNLNGVCVKK